MSKLTAEVARRDIGHLKSFQSDPKVGLSLKEEKYLQALEIALPVLEQQENKCEKCKGTGQMDSGGTQPWGESILVTCDCQPTTDTYRQIENDVWIEWGGGERPVDLLSMVQPKLRSGKIVPSEVACYWEWHHYQSINDIIAYRVIENDGRDG